MKELDDLDPMPFGEHRNVPMQDVPAHYFHWLWTTGGFKSLTKNIAASRSDRYKVAKYIESRLNHLRKEHPDGIWS